MMNHHRQWCLTMLRKGSILHRSSTSYLFNKNARFVTTTSSSSSGCWSVVTTSHPSNNTNTTTHPFLDHGWVAMATLVAATTTSVLVSCDEEKEEKEPMTTTTTAASASPEDEITKPPLLVGIKEEEEEEDEPTTCTICLINRQGPCRPYWRKFEKCMKDNAPSSDDEDQSSMGEKCDEFMLPWITCIQKHRHRYTLISNAFFNKELIHEVEEGVIEDEKVLLDLKDVDLKSIVQMSHEWSSHHHFITNNNNHDDDNHNNHKQEEEELELVEGYARFNFWQTTTTNDKESKDDDDNEIEKKPSSSLQRSIEIAYVKDQDGNLLGYDQFFDFKKSIPTKKKEDDDDDDSTSNETDTSTSTSSTGNTETNVGICKFHVNPKTTTSIQLFALYKDRPLPLATTNNNDKDSSNPEVKTTSDDQPITQKSIPEQTLYYSSLISMKDIPVQPTSIETNNNNNNNNNSDDEESTANSSGDDSQAA